MRSSSESSARMSYWSQSSQRTVLFHCCPCWPRGWRQSEALRTSEKAKWIPWIRRAKISSASLLIASAFV
eukprot:13819886-Alexandrium_andersonii.AAC.1